MNSKRTIPVLLLLMIMSLPFILVAYLQAKQQILRKQMLRKLEYEQLITIQIEKDNVIWIEQGKECMVGDDMFDVKEIKQTGNLLTLKGIFDYKEKELKCMLAKQSKPTKETSSLNQLYLFFSLMTFQQLANIHFHSYSSTVSTYCFVQPDLYSSPVFDLRHPPPDNTFIWS